MELTLNLFQYLHVQNTKAILVSSSITAYIILNLSQTFASKASIQDSFYKSCNLSLFSLVSLGWV
jgi:hypothetical protein